MRRRGFVGGVFAELGRGVIRGQATNSESRIRCLSPNYAWRAVSADLV